MAVKSAVLFISNDTDENTRPLFLQRIMGTPLLTWLSNGLAARGIHRCLMICPTPFLERAKACFPDSIALTCATDWKDVEVQTFFVAGQTEPVLVIPTPVVDLGSKSALFADDCEDIPTGICTIPQDILAAAPQDRSEFRNFLDQNGISSADSEGFAAVTAPDELADWQPILKRLYLYELSNHGVDIWDYDNCYVEPSVQVGAGTVLMPGTILRGTTVIGENCTIGPNTLLENAVIGCGTKVNASQIYDSTVADRTSIGPFAYIRPNCRIGSDVKLGDFVEVKNSVIGDGTKVSHLTYIGDSDVGKRINFGCGTVTVNYDRAKKFRTVIEDDAFIGCNTNLIAPVKVGSGSYIAAGSTITEDVPARALSIARARQSNKEDWATKHKLKEK